MLLRCAVAVSLGGCPSNDDGSANGGESPGGNTGNGAGGQGAGTGEGGSNEPPAGAIVFDTSVLHQIDITVEEQYLDQLENDLENRVPCTFTFDGMTVENAGIRKKGFLGSSDSLSGKPGFSAKFDELEPGSKLDGLKKLLLNNGKEDATFASEHTGYAIHRMFGRPAALTSYAVVRLNGASYGLFVVKEPEASDYCERNFGEGNDDGNMYEGYYQLEDQSLGDFVTHPEIPELKDEVEEGRTRDDLVEFASRVDTADDDDFQAVVGEVFDLDGYITSLAIDDVIGYWDSYHYFLNNWYLYHNPVDDRFVYLPHGMDQLQYTEMGYPMGRLAQRIFDHPLLGPALDEERARVRAEIDVAALHARLDEVAAALHAAPDLDERTLADVAAFDENLPSVKDAIAGLEQ